MSGRCRAAARACSASAGCRPSPHAVCSQLGVEPVQERAGVQRRAARGGDGQGDDGLQHVGVVGGVAGAGVDHLVQQHGQVLGGQVPQGQPGLVRPDRDPAGARRRRAGGGCVRLCCGRRGRPCSPARPAAAGAPAPPGHACRVAVNQPAHSRIIRFVFPLPVEPTMTMCRAHDAAGQGEHRVPAVADGADGPADRDLRRRGRAAGPRRGPRSGPGRCGPAAATAGRRR